MNKGGRGTYHRWGGQKPVLGGVLWYVFPSPDFPPPLVLDAAFLLTVGGFLLTVRLSYLQLIVLACFGAVLLTILVFFFYLQLELLSLQWESASNKGQAKKLNCKQKTPTAS